MVNFTSRLHQAVFGGSNKKKSIHSCGICQFIGQPALVNCPSLNVRDATGSPSGSTVCGSNPALWSLFANYPSVEGGPVPKTGSVSSPKHPGPCVYSVTADTVDLLYPDTRPREAAYIWPWGSETSHFRPSTIYLKIGL